MEEACAGRPTEENLEQIRQDLMQGRGAALVPIYSCIQARLSEAGVGSTALRAGDPAPDFLLPDHQGRLVSSESLLSEGPLVVRFLRGSWCPFAMAELEIFQAAASQFEALPVTIVTLVPDTGAFPRNLKANHGISLTILSDVDSGVGLSFGIVFSTPPEVRQALAAFGADLPARHGNAIWILPAPATFVIGSDGVIMDANTSLELTEIQRPSHLLSRLKRLLGNGNGGRRP
jgi:peroxiredoxin